MTPNVLHKRRSSEGSGEPLSAPTHASILNGAANTRIVGGSFVINIIYKTVSRVLWGLLFLLLCGLFSSAWIYLQGALKAQQDVVLSLIRPVTSGARESMDVLYNRVAINAVLNAGGRAEDAKCHPGTREEVISHIEQWMDDREGTNRTLWLSAPAGAGKTAIMKTISERSKARGAVTANFFFFRGDSNRNSAQPLVATLLYQIFQLFPAARDAVATILSTNPLLLDASVQEQFDKLVSPLSHVIRQSTHPNTAIVLLIDGLDECEIDAQRSQEQILHALHGVVALQGSIFYTLIASRPEPHVKMVFNHLASKTLSIFLDGDYEPDKDIKFYVTAEFDRIKACHPSADLLPAEWPSKLDIQGIVAKSSGQFIYAATVMRYLAYSSSVPSFSLERVQGIVRTGSSSPFTQLDSVYIHILSHVDDHEATRDILSFILLNHDHSQFVLCLSRVIHQTFGDVMPSIIELLSTYKPRYTKTMVASSLSGIAALVRYQDGQPVFYHASLTNFLCDPSRSHNFYIDVKAFADDVLATFLMSTPPHLICRFLQSQCAYSLLPYRPKFSCLESLGHIFLWIYRDWEIVIEDLLTGERALQTPNVYISPITHVPTSCQTPEFPQQDG